MKWRSYEVGPIKLALGELRSIHGCNPRDPKLSSTSIVGQYIAFYYRGTEKWSQIIKLERK